MVVEKLIQIFNTDFNCNKCLTKHSGYRTVIMNLYLCIVRWNFMEFSKECSWLINTDVRITIDVSWYEYIFSWYRHYCRLLSTDYRQREGEIWSMQLVTLNILKQGMQKRSFSFKFQQDNQGTYRMFIST